MDAKEYWNRRAVSPDKELMAEVEQALGEWSATVSSEAWEEPENRGFLERRVKYLDALRERVRKAREPK